MRLPKMRRDQYEVATDKAKIKVLACGRRWGKTVLGLILACVVLRNHGRVAWIAPNYKNSRPLWRGAIAATALDVKAKRCKVNTAERTIESLRGGLLAIYSGDNIDAARGEAFHLVICDEAARLSEIAFTEVLLPTVADFDGDIYLISTPYGRNWFYLEWMRGYQEEPGYASWQKPTCDNPIPSIRRAYEMAQHRVPEDVYDQEWNAAFSEAGMVFRKVRQAAVLEPQPPAQGKRYIMGVDVGRKQDYTVVSVLDPVTKKMVWMHRMGKLDWEVQADRVADLARRYPPYMAHVESNGVGDPFISMLVKRKVPVTPFTTTNATKQNIVTALQGAFDHGELQILSDKTLISELEMFESDKTLGGRLKFGAPDGHHDDCVISLALAWDMARHDQTIRVKAGEVI